MSHARVLVPWSELLVVLALGTTAIIVLSAAASAALRGKTSAVWRRTVWEAALAGVLIVVACELTGVARALVFSTVRVVEASRRWIFGEPGTFQALTGAEAELTAGASPALSSTAAPDDAPLVDPECLDHPLSSAPHAIAAAGTDGRETRTAIPGGILTESLGNRVAPWLGLGWASGSLLIAVRLFFGRLLLLVFRRRKGREFEGDDQRVHAVARRLGMRGNACVLRRAGLTSPMAFGTLRPTVVLPERFEECYGRDEQEVMLAHELAHLAAHDPAWRAVADLACAALWWHPLVWWARHALREASEEAADEASLAIAGGPAVLAKCLVQLGRQLIPPRHAAWVSIEGSGFGSSLGRRVERLLAMAGQAAAPRPRMLQPFTRILGSAAIVTAAIFSTAWSRSFDREKGDTMLGTIQYCWRHSLAALALFAVAGPGDLPAVANTQADDSRVLVVIQDKGEGKYKEEDEIAAEEAREAALKDRLKQLMHEIEEARAAGRLKEADKLAHEADDIKQGAERWIIRKVQQAEKAANEKQQVLEQLARKREVLKELLVKKAPAEEPDGRKDEPSALRDDIKKLKIRIEQLEAENAKLRRALGDRDSAKGETEAKMKEKLQALEKLGQYKEMDEFKQKLMNELKLIGEEKAKAAGYKKTRVDEKLAGDKKLLVDDKSASAKESQLDVVHALKEFREEINRLRNDLEELHAIVKKQGAKHSDDYISPTK